MSTLLLCSQHIKALPLPAWPSLLPKLLRPASNSILSPTAHSVHTCPSGLTCPHSLSLTLPHSFPTLAGVTQSVGQWAQGVAWKGLQPTCSNGSTVGTLGLEEAEAFLLPAQLLSGHHSHHQNHNCRPITPTLPGLAEESAEGGLWQLGPM